MARDRILTGRERPGDESVDVALRPKRLNEIVGQRAVVERLEIAMAAAKQRTEPLEHILFEMGALRELSVPLEYGGGKGHTGRFVAFPAIGFVEYLQYLNRIVRVRHMASLHFFA